MEKGRELALPDSNPAAPIAHSYVEVVAVVACNEAEKLHHDISSERERERDLEIDSHRPTRAF